MFLDNLKDFIGDTIHERDLTRGDKVLKIRVRELSANEIENLFIGVDANDPKKNKGLRNRVIALSVVGEDDKPAFTDATAGALPNDTANQMQAIVFEVNGIGKKAEEPAKNE